MKTQAQQLAQLHQQQQQRQQQLQQLHGQQIRQQQQQQQAVQQQQHQLNIKQEVVENATGQTTTQTGVDQNNTNNISQNISNGNGGVVGQHLNLNKGANGHFVDSTTTNSSMTSLTGFTSHNNNIVSRTGSCDNINVPGAAPNSNRELFSLQEELLNGISKSLSTFSFLFHGIHILSTILVTEQYTYTYQIHFLEHLINI